MSSNTESNGHIYEVFDELEKFINSVLARDKEMKLKLEKHNLNEIEETTQNSNGLFDSHSKANEIANQNIENKLENAVFKDENNDKKNNNLELKDNQNNFEDSKEELEMSEMMIICDEDDNKAEVEANVTNDKDSKKIKKDTRKKKSNKQKYDKNLDSKSKVQSRKEDSKKFDKKRSWTPSKYRSSKDSSLKKQSKIDKYKDPKKLDRMWQIVRYDPSDFIGWTYLLQYVDEAKDIKAAREAYDAFLELYPYCYGYWRNYADYERENGTKENCEKVFDRGLKAIPLSVDLWIHYIDYMKSIYPYNEDLIRELFERAVDACGIEFRSDFLWKDYIKFELECKEYIRVTDIYDRLIATPTHGYLNNFDSFKYFIKKYPKNKILEIGKFLDLRKEVLVEIKEADVKKNRKMDSDSDSDYLADPIKQRIKEESLMNEKMIVSRTLVHKITAEMVSLRLPYEKKIIRPYFHVKALTRTQISNWKEYLEFEIGHGVYKRIVILFERCLIACALYEEFWIKYASYLESLESDDQDVKDRIEDIYIRACSIHHKNKPGINLIWALHLENKGEYDEAAQILDKLYSVGSHKKIIIQRRINLERRRNRYDKVCELYEHYISTAKSSSTSILLTIKYARFVWKILNNSDKASSILWAEVEKINNVQKSDRLLLQLIEINFSDDPMNINAVVKLIDSILSMKSINLEQQVLFAQRKVEYLEEFGKDMLSINKATTELKNYMKIYSDYEKKRCGDAGTNCSKT